jgi:lambda family phage tail tape measure protein
MATDIATLSLRVNALEVSDAEKKLKGLEDQSKKTESAAQGLSGMFKGLAVALGALQLASMVKDAAMMAARYETLGAVMKNVGGNAGYTADQMNQYEKSLRKTGIAMIESRTILARLAQANIDLSKSSELARIAQDAAVIGGINSSEAFERMVQAITSGEVEILRHIGLNVDFQASYERLAAQLGKTTKSLTAQEKMQAKVNAVMGAGPGIAGTYEAAMGTAGKMITSITRYTDDLKVSLGAAFGPALTLLVSQLTDELKDMLEGVEDGKSTIDDWGKSFRSVIISIEAEVIRLSMLLDKVGGTLTALASFGGNNPLGSTGEDGEDRPDGSLNAWGSRTNKMLEDRYNSSDKQLQDLADMANALEEPTPSRITPVGRKKKILAAIEKPDKKAASEAKRQAEEEAKQYEATLDRLLPLRKAYKDYAADLVQLKKAESDSTLSEQDRADALTALNKEMDDAIEKTSKLSEMRAIAESAISAQQINLASKVAAGTLTKTDALPFEVDLLRQRLKLQQEYLQTLTSPDEKLAYNSQLEAIERVNLELVEKERLLRLTDGWEGAKQALSDYSEMAMNMGQNVQGAVTSAFQSMEDAMVDFVAKGKMDFSSLVDSIISDLARVAIRQSITGPLASGLSGLLSGMATTASAHGNVFASAGLSAYSNSIVNQPTVFPFARGVGLMGEAGPEAIMPLKRLSSGNLGVETSGGGVTINIHNNASGVQATTEVVNNGNGGKSIEVMIDEVMSRNMMKSGSLSSKALSLRGAGQPMARR